MEMLISLGYYASSLGFLIATYVTFDAFRRSAPSVLKTVLEYLCIGTGTFFMITVFQKLSDLGLFGISFESTDIWWHVMFYLAMISFYLAFKTLATLGTTEGGAVSMSSSATTTWALISAAILAAVFILPAFVDSTIQTYTSSHLAELGAHHFLAFALAGIVGAYVFSAKIFLGQIGRAIAAPMIIAIWALAIQHFWELLTESWKVIAVSPSEGEGVEKIFLVIAAACVIAAALRLKKLATK